MAPARFPKFFESDSAGPLPEVERQISAPIPVAIPKGLPALPSQALCDSNRPGPGRHAFEPFQAWNLALVAPPLPSQGCTNFALPKATHSTKASQGLSTRPSRIASSTYCRLSLFAGALSSSQVFQDGPALQPVRAWDEPFSCGNPLGPLPSGPPVKKQIPISKPVASSTPNVSPAICSRMKRSYGLSALNAAIT